MKRQELVKKLMQEGFSEKTLVNFSDKQLISLSERILAEQPVKTKTVPVTSIDTTTPAGKQAAASLLNNPKTIRGSYEVTENKSKLSKAQSDNMDTDKDGDIDAKDLKNLRNKKKKAVKKTDVKEEKKEKWIQKAVHPSKKGVLKKALGVKKDEKIPAEKLKKAAKKGGKLGQRARFAMNVKGLKENNQELNNWIEKVVNENYYPATSKKDLLKMIKSKIK